MRAQESTNTSTRNYWSSSTKGQQLDREWCWSYWSPKALQMSPVWRGRSRRARRSPTIAKSSICRRNICTQSTAPSASICTKYMSSNCVVARRRNASDCFNGGWYRNVLRYFYVRSSSRECSISRAWIRAYQLAGTPSVSKVLK